MIKRKKLEIPLTISLVMLSAVTVFELTFFLTAWIFQTTRLHPPAFLAQMITSVVGLCCCFAISGTLGYMMRTKQWAIQQNVFSPIFAAMQRIAQGDFSVRLDDTYRDNALMGQLTQGVNNMALELNQMEAMRQEFIANVSHELQTPLTSIHGFAQALQNEHVSVADHHHYLAIIADESMRLSKLTDNLLKLASLETQQVKFAPTAYQLDAQLRHLILASEPQWLHKAIDVSVALDDVAIVADADLLSQVWINLLHNSIKFTPAGGRICVQLQQVGDAITCTIADTGIGISPDDQAHIFERFFIADKSRTHAQNGGSGLGLSITQKIVAMHQGTITVCSQPAQGTTFTVSLPAPQRAPSENVDAVHASLAH